MTDTSDLLARNTEFAARHFARGLTINPSGNMMVIGCLDPRVDPTQVLGIGHGEAAMIRNVGGRVTPATLRTLGMLGKVGRANSETHRPGVWNLSGLVYDVDTGLVELVVPETALSAA